MYKICFALDILVYYARKDSLIPLAREDVWEAVNGKENLMDKNGVFAPEVFGYRVVQIVLLKDGNAVAILFNLDQLWYCCFQINPGVTEIPILQPNVSGKISPLQSDGTCLLLYSSQ